jgi:hypothetical protein
VIELLARRSLIALIRELEEQLAGLQDVADQVIRSRSSGALADIQRQLLQTGINSRIVVNDIVRYAQDPFWKHGVVDFTEVDPPPACNAASFREPPFLRLIVRRRHLHSR